MIIKEKKGKKRKSKDKPVTKAPDPPKVPIKIDQIIVPKAPPEVSKVPLKIDPKIEVPKIDPNSPKDPTTLVE